jgi:tetratricopeptide (TPR) repeat protein
MAIQAGSMTSTQQPTPGPPSALAPPAPGLLPTTLPTAALPAANLSFRPPTAISDVSPLAQAQQAVDSLKRGGSLAQATRQINDALHRASDDPELLCLASEVAIRYHEMDKAGALAQHAVSLAPDNARALGDLALAFMFSNHLPDAVAAADRALSIDPHNAPSLAVKGGEALARKIGIRPPILCRNPARRRGEGARVIAEAS